MHIRFQPSFVDLPCVESGPGCNMNEKKTFTILHPETVSGYCVSKLNVKQDAVHMFESHQITYLNFIFC